MSKDRDDIEDLFSDFDDEKDNGEVPASDGEFLESFDTEDDFDEDYDDESEIDIIGSDRDSDTNFVNYDKSYDEGEEYLDDDYFDEEGEEYYDDDYDDLQSEKNSNSSAKGDTEIINRMNKKNSGSSKKGINPKVAVIAAIVIILIVVVIAIAKCAGGRSNISETESESVTTSASTLTEQDSSSEIYQLLQSYLTARLANDMDTLATLVDDVSVLPENDSTSTLFASYQDIVVYTAPGLNDGEYVAYVYSQVDLTNYEENLPDLQFFYLRTNDQGSVYIASTHSDEENAYMEQLNETDEVQNLVNQVWSVLDELATQNSDLANLINILYGNETETAESTETTAETAATETAVETSAAETEAAEQSSEAAAESGGMVATNDTVEATSNVRIRASASTEAENLGTFPGGETATRIERGDTWSHIQYDGIDGYVLNEYLQLAE